MRTVKITFTNGDEMILAPGGNTYTGEVANEFGHIVRKNNMTTMQIVAHCNYGGNIINKIIKSIELVK